MANPSNFQITPCVENHEINFRLYLWHTRPGPMPALGTQAVIKWPVYDGPGPKPKVVACAQGLRIYADNGNWHNTFSIVFDEERFKGSTLQVMGISAAEQGEWAIVGGTGQFARATGVISKKLYEQRNDGNWAIELAIHAFCPLPKGSRRLVTKIGPWGGDSGKDQDITEAPRRLESITVCRKKDEVVNSIAFSYIDQIDQKRTAGPWGGLGGEPYTIKLDRSEFVKEVTGRFGTYQGSTVILSLKFVTNINTYGPFGDVSAKGTRFSVPVQDSKVVGFFGRGGKHFLHAVGVYVRPF